MAKIQPEIDLSSSDSDSDSDESASETDSAPEEKDLEDSAPEDKKAVTKKRAKITVVGEEVAEHTLAMDRDEAREEEMQSALADFKANEEEMKKVRVVKKKKMCCYALRKATGCCFPIPLIQSVLESNNQKTQKNIQKWSKKKEGPEVINAMDEKGRTAFSLAIKEDRADIADLFVSRPGAVDVNLGDKFTAMTPLHSAVQMGHNQTIERLIKLEAKLDVKDCTGMTPLMLACHIGDISVAESLIEAGANLQAKDKKGWRPIHYAAYGGDVEMVEVLCEYNVKHRQKDKMGFRPEDLARLMNHGPAQAFLQTFKPPDGLTLV